MYLLSSHSMLSMLAYVHSRSPADHETSVPQKICAWYNICIPLRCSTFICNIYLYMVYWKNTMKEYMEAHIGQLWGVDGRKSGLILWASVDVIGSGSSSVIFGPTNGAEDDWSNLK